MAEGLGVVVLEEYEHARKRGASIIAEVWVTGCRLTAPHDRLPVRKGKGAAYAMSAALRDAKLNPDEIQYVNAHGTSTPLGDKAETVAIKSVFTRARPQVRRLQHEEPAWAPVGSVGRQVEFVISALALKEQVAPPTINLDNPDPECDLDYIPHSARQMKLRSGSFEQLRVWQPQCLSDSGTCS